MSPEKPLPTPPVPVPGARTSRAPVDPRLLRLSRPARRWIALAAALAVARTAAVVAFGLAAGQLAARALDPGAATPGPWVFALALGIPALAQIATAWAERRSAHLAAAGIIADLREQAVAELSRQDVRTRTANAARWRTALTEGLDGIAPYLGSFLPVLASTCIAIPTVLVIVGILDPTSALLSAFTLPLIPIFMVLIGKLTQGRTEKRLRGLDVLTGQMLDLVEGLPTLRAFRRARTPVRELTRLGESHRSSTMRVLRIAFLSGTVLEFFATLSVALVAVGIGLRLVGGEMSLAAGLCVLIIIPEVYVPLRALGTAYHSAQEGIEGAAAVLSLLDEPTPALVDSAAAAPYALSFAGLSVAGRDGAAPAGLSARFEPGELGVLAGANGAGKSSALLAALGLLDDGVTGTCGFSGADGRALSGEPLYAALAWVPQSPAASGTLAPADTLSTGRRRLADLETELRRKRPILLLDEPTAHLDDEHADAVIARLRGAADNGRLVVAASHDPRLLAAADKIVTARRADRADGPTGPTGPTRQERQERQERPTRPTQHPEQRAAADTRRTATVADPLGRTTEHGAAAAAGTRAVTLPRARRGDGLRAALRDLSRITGVRARHLVLPVAAGTLTLLASLTLTVVSAWLITRAWERPPVLELTLAVTAVRALGISRAAFRYLDRVVGHDLALRAVARARVRIYSGLAALPTGRLAALDRSALLSRAGSDVDELGDAVVRVFIPVGVAAATSSLAVVFLALLSPAAAALLAAGLLVAGLAAPWLAARSARRVEDERASAEERWTAALERVLSDRGELRVRGESAAAVEAASAAAGGLARADGLGAPGAAAGAAAAAAGRVLSALFIIAVVAVAGAGGGADVHSAQWVGVLVLLPLAAFEATDALPGAATTWTRARGAIARIRELGSAHEPSTATRPSSTANTTAALGPGSARENAAPGVMGGEGEPSRSSGARGARGARTGGPSQGRADAGELVLDGLSWGWPETGPLGTRSETIPAGGRRTIVAPNGAGKSTLLLTIAGLLPPLAGRVLVDGEEVAAAGRAGVASPQVLLTAEDAHVFATTVRDNLALGAPTAGDSAMVEVLRAVGLGPWLDALPAGLSEVLVGGAAALSGGQRRRLLLARALLTDAPVLLLDEPTEHLDREGRWEILDLLDGRPLPGARAQRTIVMVRHDPEAWRAERAGGDAFGLAGRGPARES